jgi:hypothetical protein
LQDYKEHLDQLPAGERQIEEAQRLLLEEASNLHKGDVHAAGRMKDIVTMLNVAIEVSFCAYCMSLCVGRPC